MLDKQDVLKIGGGICIALIGLAGGYVSRPVVNVPEQPAPIVNITKPIPAMAEAGGEDEPEPLTIPIVRSSDDGDSEVELVLNNRAGL